MEQQQRSLIFTATVGLIILAIIVGSIYYLVKFIQSRVSSTAQTPQASVEEIAVADATPEGGSVEGAQITPNAISTTPEATRNTPSASAGNPPADEQSSPTGKKIYNAGDFQATYPNTWGLLTCSNSKNFELDPINRADAKIACELAVKAITVVVGNNQGCTGDTVKLGNVEAIKSQASADGYTKYQWCTKTSPTLNITHRASQSGERATSKQDFSKQIEEMISKLTFARGS